jgi:hypothetical protein
MPNESTSMLRGEALRRLIDAELAEALKGDSLMERALRGEAVDFGSPTLNALMDRTARRLAAIPDAAVPRIAEARGAESIEFILREMIVEALDEVTGVFGFLADRGKS